MRQVEDAQLGGELTSRQAAIDELTGHNLADCDINYWTAITMLQAVLEEEEDSPNDKADAEEINGLDGEDRRSIQKRKCRYNVFRGIHN